MTCYMNLLDILWSYLLFCIIPCSLLYKFHWNFSHFVPFFTVLNCSLYQSFKTVAWFVIPIFAYAPSQSISIIKMLLVIGSPLVQPVYFSFFVILSSLLPLPFPPLCFAPSPPPTSYITVLCQPSFLSYFVTLHLYL